MEKHWYCMEFNHGVTTIDTGREVASFLNKNNLKPEEVKVMPSHVHDTGYDHADNKFGITILYFSDKELPRY